MAKRARILSVLLLLLATGLSQAQQPASRRFPPGYVDPEPVLQAAAKAIGVDNLKCVTISGTGYAGMVGQQRLRMECGLAARRSRWPTTRAP